MKGMGSWACFFPPIKIKKGNFSLDLEIHIFLMFYNEKFNNDRVYTFVFLVLKNGPQNASECGHHWGSSESYIAGC